MKLRCVLDGLILPAEINQEALVVYDGDEPFELEAVEALFYRLVSATPAELLALERSRYRMLRRAEDFEYAAE